ncbi:3'-5' exonuclease [Tsukamurella soli]|uniref:DNA 3'-5' helicase n=1 Tax=Tsukamurella soli TaxID=644556 RepID=A0ABP8J0L1_9ACTN
MPTLVWASNNRAMPKLDKSIDSKLVTFLTKLSADDTLPGLHIEPIHGSADRRVRTGRVDKFWRAVLFRLDTPHDPTYIYMGVWPHDDAIALAKTSRLQINPATKVAEAIMGELDGVDDRRKRVSVPDDGTVGRAITRPQPGYLESAGYTSAELVERLGFEPDVAAAVVGAPDENAAWALGDHLAPWQADALLNLLTGTSLDTITEQLELQRAAVTTSSSPQSEDEQLAEALRHPAARMQFAFIEDDAELRRVIEGGDFAAWRTFLHPEQRALVERSFSGPARVSGGAGTGKTVVAIHRAALLARRDPTARIVLTTFNRTLADNLRRDVALLAPDLPVHNRIGDPGIYVGGIDSLASAVLRRTPDQSAATAALLGSPTKKLGPDRRRTDHIWREAARTVGNLEPRLATPAFLDAEYTAVVLANRIITLERYLTIPRPGRRVRLSRAQRMAVWHIVEEFRRRSVEARAATYAEVLALAAEQVRIDGARGATVADHVVVDEAQDLGPTHWRLLRALVPEGPDDLFIAEDGHQRIYGQPVTLKHLGVHIVGRATRLTLNYRTTAQNLAFALGILAGAQFADITDEPDSTTGYRSARRGPAPELVECASTAAEVDTVVGRVAAWLDDVTAPGSVAVLTRTSKDRDTFTAALQSHGISAAAVDSDPAPEGAVQVLTMHRAKGMEFRRVILAAVTERHLPSDTVVCSVPDEERNDALLRERSLLYVAATRARDEVVVTWSGPRSSLL